MADGKWITDLAPQMPLLEAAHRVVEVRLQVVRDHLPRVLQDAHRDTEHVHQLRVSTRRADAALRIFADCLPKRVYKQARRHLQKLRRAAGAARDWDVFRLHLLEWEKHQPEADRIGLDFLIGYAVGQRSAVNECLLDTCNRQFPKFAAFIQKTVSELRSPESPDRQTLGELARFLLTELHQEMARLAAGDLENYDHLHQVRIAGKRLRYAMEIFAPCFDPAFKDSLYPRIEEMQEILGRANDSHVASCRLADLRDQLRNLLGAGWNRFAVGLRNLLRHHQRRVPLERRSFLRWWQRWQLDGATSLPQFSPSQSPSAD